MALRWSGLVARGVALVLAVPAAAQQAAPPASFVAVGTADVTGVYYPVGVALCRLVNQHRPETGLRCSAVPTDGSVANIEGLRAGTYQFAIVQSDVQAEAVAGTAPFTAPYADLRAVVGLYPEPLTLVARGDAGIARAEDLAGKRVWTGAEGSGTRALAEAMLRAVGASPAPVPEIAAADVADALCEGRIDAFLLAIGHPALVVQEAAGDCGAILVPIEGPAIEAVIAGDPALVAATIPGGLYEGNPATVASFGVGATLVARADEPADRVHTMLSEIFADLGMLRGLEPVLADLDPAATGADGLTAPLHPGAMQYFREQGWRE